ncbi:MAG TPA: tripartite tricarboxylate transporter substrate-binding protein, partial [Burkholderiales bacterium]|nr:tripartite tricarboxylate transporter substrate-binding protein [Burkholderiales bacterium]
MSALFRTFLAALMTCVATAQAVAQSAAAQSFPAKAVHIVVPFPPVGAADLLSRALGKQLGETWGQAVVVDNRPGAGGNIGTLAATKAAPDGYTIVISASGPLAANKTLYPTLG